jgi:hypothetical protein
MSSNYAAIPKESVSSSSESFEQIESLEQDLIQHIRTAGIRKSRETDIIEELMGIRRERRRLFGGLRSEIQLLEEANAALKSKLTRLVAAQEAEVASKHAGLIEQLKDRDIQLQNANKKMESEIRLIKERYEAAARSKVEKISQQYEDKLRLLDAKMQDLSIVSKEKVKEQARQMAKEMVSNIEHQLKENSTLKLQKYVEPRFSVYFGLF